MMRFSQAQTEELLRRSDWCQLLSFDPRPMVSAVQFAPEDTILEEGTTPQQLYYLLEGQAKVFLSHPNGRISLINFLDAPCFLGEMELLDSSRPANGVQAMTTCTCLTLSLCTYRTLLLNDARFLRYLCLFLSRKATSNTKNYARNQSYPLEVRLAGFILRTASGTLYRERHTEVAEYLGVTYRHLLYVLASMVKDGLLQREKQGYRIIDEPRLRALAGQTDDP